MRYTTAHNEDVPRIRKFLGSFVGQDLTGSEVEFGIVTETRGRIIGYVEALPFGKNVYLCRLKVHKAFRGQGQGRRLVLAVLKRAQNNGTEVLFAVTQPNRPAARILESLGAELTDKAELAGALLGASLGRYSDEKHSFWKFKLNGGR